MIMKRLSFALTLLLSSSLWAADLTVSAAASLTQAFQEIGSQFEAQNPGTKLKFNYINNLVREYFILFFFFLLQNFAVIK